MKVKRYIIEYANDKIRFYESLADQFPNFAEDYARAIKAVDRAVWYARNGLATEDEVIQAIHDSAHAKY